MIFSVVKVYQFEAVCRPIFGISMISKEESDEKSKEV